MRICVGKVYRLDFMVYCMFCIYYAINYTRYIVLANIFRCITYFHNQPRSAIPEANYVTLRIHIANFALHII